MVWILVGVLVLVAVVLTAVVLGRRPASMDIADVDPLFMVGIPLAGAGIALMTTVEAVGFGLLAVGLSLLGAGAWRSRQRPG